MKIQTIANISHDLVSNFKAGSSEWEFEHYNYKFKVKLVASYDFQFKTKEVVLKIKCEETHPIYGDQFIGQIAISTIKDMDLCLEWLSVEQSKCNNAYQARRDKFAQIMRGEQ